MDLKSSGHARHFVQVLFLTATYVAMYAGTVPFGLLCIDRGFPEFDMPSDGIFKFVSIMLFFWPSSLFRESGYFLTANKTDFALNLICQCAAIAASSYCILFSMTKRRKLVADWHIRCLFSSSVVYVFIMTSACFSKNNPSPVSSLFSLDMPFTVGNGLSVSFWMRPFWWGLGTPLGPFFAFPYALAWGYGLMYLGRWAWRRFLRGRFSRGGAGAGAASASEAEAVPVSESPEGSPREGG